jgi:hypothetical protein
MLAMMHVLPRLAGQARASASNGASTGQSSPILEFLKQQFTIEKGYYAPVYNIPYSEPDG